MKNSDTNFLPAIYWILCKRLKKRGWLLFLSILCIAPARGQLKSELNLPRAGDEIIKQQVEYKDQGRAGENVLWDFGKLQLVNDEYTLSYSEPEPINDSIYILGLDTILAKNIAEGQLLVGTEHNTMYYYYLDKDRMWTLGHENPTALLKYNPRLIDGIYPMQYQDSCSFPYQSEGLYSSTVPFTADGEVQMKADAYGIMILPSGDTLRNVLRTRTNQTIHQVFTRPDTTIENNSSIETFKWFSEGYRYPIFETVHTTVITDTADIVNFATAFFYPPQEHYYLETDPENQAIIHSKNENKKNNLLESSAFNAFPNPMTSILNVEIFIPMEAKIKIQLRSVSSHSVYINENKGKFDSGIYRFQFNVSQLPVGYYLLNVWADNYMFSATLLKK